MSDRPCPVCEDPRCRDCGACSCDGCACHLFENGDAEDRAIATAARTGARVFTYRRDNGTVGVTAEPPEGWSASGG